MKFSIIGFRSACAVSMLFAANISNAESQSFDGNYVGVSLGYSQLSVHEGMATWSQAGSIDYIGSGGRDSHSNSAIGGLNVGRNWQFENFVIGAELGGSLLDGKANGTLLSYDSTLGSPSNHVASSTKLKSFVNVKAKLGYVIDSQTMIYGMAGIASGRVSRTATGLTGTTGDVFLDAGVSNTNTKTMIGYTYGIGVEKICSKQFSLKFELNYIDLGSKDFSYGGTTFLVPSRMSQSVKVTNSTASFILAYKF